MKIIDDSLKNFEILPEDDKLTIKFTSYLKESFISRQLKIIFRKGELRQLYFSSNEYGTAEWESERGIVSCHRWEDEDSVSAASKLSRHYPVVLLNGAQNDSFALDKIIPDVTGSLEDRKLAEMIDRITKGPEGGESARFLYLYFSANI